MRKLITVLSVIHSYRDINGCAVIFMDEHKSCPRLTLFSNCENGLIQLGDRFLDADYLFRFLISELKTPISIYNYSYLRLLSSHSASKGKKKLSIAEELSKKMPWLKVKGLRSHLFSDLSLHLIHSCFGNSHGGQHYIDELEDDQIVLKDRVYHYESQTFQAGRKIYSHKAGHKKSINNHRFSHNSLVRKIRSLF